MVKVVVKISVNIFLILALFSFSLFAQNKHTVLWNVGEYMLDFRDGSLKVPFEKHDWNPQKSRWYVDEMGNLKIIYDGQKLIHLLGNNSVPIVGGENIKEDEVSFFIPVPANKDMIYCIGEKTYSVIDLSENKIIKTSSLKNTAQTHLAVRHFDKCSIWLIFFDKLEYYKYLITKDGIDYIETVELEKNDYENVKFYSSNIWRINLSKDCKHYTALVSGDRNNEIYYGDFDNKTGDFHRKYSYRFTQCTYNSNVIISPDNTKIIYHALMGESSRGDDVFFSIPISVDGVPDFENSNVLFTIQRTRALYSITDCFYAIDGNIYFLLYVLREIIKIGFDKPDIYKDVYNMPTIFYPRLSFVSDWFSDDYQENCIPYISYKEFCESGKIMFSLDNYSQIKSFHWSFGDGTVSEEEFPVHVYKDLKKYDVTVETISFDGQKNTFHKEIVVSPIIIKAPKIICDD
ncbi:MAG: PKD domain-containing protein [Bacteroidales bacterium]|nr:PKD domain-containing protein [Bacteroidales bacterium]